MDNVRFEVLFAQSLSDQLLNEFKQVVQSNGYDERDKLNRMRMDAIDRHEFSVRVPLEGTKAELMTVTWQRHLANIAIQNIYNHS